MKEKGGTTLVVSFRLWSATMGSLWAQTSRWSPTYPSPPG